MNKILTTDYWGYKYQSGVSRYRRETRKYTKNDIHDIKKNTNQQNKTKIKLLD